MFSRKTSILLPLATAALMLGLAGPASAATNFTSSQITTPADNSFVAYNVDSPNTIHVQGTTAGGDSNADLVCFYGASRRVLATGVTVTAGAFSADLPLNSFTTGAPRPYCVLRAIPTADPTNYPPEAASAFAGPRIGYGRSQTYKVAGSGLNQNAVWDYFIAQAQSQGYTDYLSLGGCGLDYSFVFDPITLAQSQSLFYCNGWTSSMDGCTSAAATCTAGTQSELRVDGNNAYPPGSARGLYSVDATHSSELLSGFPPLTFTKSIDPLNGNVHIDETDPIVSCSPNRTAFHTDSTDPAWSTDCSSFASTGVRLDRTIQSDQNGRRARIVDTWSSTDGASHDLEVLYDEEFRGDSGTNPSPTFAYSWMDGSSFSPATAGQTVQGPGGSGPATVFVDGNGATADAFAQPQGAVTIAPAPTSVRWYSTSNPYSYGVFRFAQTIPAGGSATVSRTYVNGGSKAEIAAQVSAEQDRLGKPSVAITSPANGSTSDTAAATVTGTASDPGGAVTGVTVNGQAATVAADGTWSKALTLAPGENTITAVASDAAGNSSSASVKVTYTPKPPPVLTPPADKVPPTLGLIIAKLKLAKMLAKGLPVTVSCSEACSFTVTLVVDSKTAKKLHLAGIVILGKKSGSLAAKGSKKVTVKLTKKAKRQLAKAKKVTISVKLTAKDTVGNGSTKTKKVTVNR